MTKASDGCIAFVCVVVFQSWYGLTPDKSAYGQFFQNRSVGGVAVSADGVLEAPTLQDARELKELRQRIRFCVPDSLDDFTELRLISLKHIEAKLAQAGASGAKLDGDALYLAGLQRVRYVLVYPEQHDIVLAGPAEGWKLDRLGNVVGRTTNRPTLVLDDLLVGLRCADTSRVEPLTCSIDPTTEGLRQLQELISRLTTIGDPDQTLRMMEDALGPQQISITGVPADSHFARTMVAADFRMKRLAMALEPSPVRGLPSYLSMLSARGVGQLAPRWWLAANYEPLGRTADRLTWELRGQGVQCLTENEYVLATGQRQRSGPASGVAAKWAQLLTDKFDEIAVEDSTFGQLRNVMDLAVVGALIEKEQLLAIAGLEAPWLMGRHELAAYPTPRQTGTKASAVRKRGGWVISVSGGVEVAPWQVAENSEVDPALNALHSQMSRKDEVGR
ncbi:MAG TPA: DUF1598 domain-containing protein [Lacipirellula sp.]